MADHIYKPHAGQLLLHQSDARFRMACCGIRWGKDFWAMHEGLKWILPLLKARKAAKVTNLNPLIHLWSVYPSFSLSRQGWRDLLGTVPKGLSPKPNKSHLILEMCEGAVVWEMKSADNPDSLVGAGPDIIVVSEGGQMQSEVWERALRPRLSTPGRLGMALFAGTPKGEGNWFHRLWQLCESPDHPDWYGINRPTWDNPAMDPDDIAEARASMPANWFDQEYGAQFLKSDGAVFRNMRDLSHEAAPYVPGQWRRPIVVGVDLAKSRDYTVFCAMDATWRILDFHRMNQVSWDAQESAFLEFCGKFRPDRIIMEANGIGDPIIHQWQKSSPYVISPFITTQMSKQHIIEDLAIAIERHQMTYPFDPQFLNELSLFTFSLTSSGGIRYMGGTGHDDMVLAAAFAKYGQARTPELPVDDPRPTPSMFETGSPLSLATAF